MKNKIILLVFLGLLFYINLNKSTQNKVKNDHIEVITEDDGINNHQNIGILSSVHENISEVMYIPTSIISFNVEPINSINKVITIDMINSKLIQLLKYKDMYISNSLNNHIKIKKTVSKFQLKTIGLMEINTRNHVNLNIYLNQISNKLGKT